MAEQLNIPKLAGQAVTDPRGAFRELNGMQLDRRTLWEVLLLFTIARVLLIGLFDGGRFVLPFGTTPILVSPMAYAAVLISGFVVMIFLVHYTGRAIGGKGTFLGSMAVAVLLEGLSLILVVVQLLAGLLLPGLVGLVSLVSIPVMLFCALSFIDELHEYGSMFKAFGMILLSILGLSFGITILLSLIGAVVGVPGLQGI